jgi:hypothetical protein
MRMSAKAKKATKNAVTLIRQGVGREELALPEGATLADVLRAARVQTEDAQIYIDGRPLEQQVALQPGAVISVVPRPARPPSLGSWQEGIGMFHGNEAFRELCEAVEKSREAEKDRA